MLLSTLAVAQNASYYGAVPVPVNDKTKSPKYASPDAFGSEVFVDGRTDVALDAHSLAAKQYDEEESAKRRQKELDKSIRADIATGQPITVLIAPEHFVQLTFLKDNEIVYPKRAFTGQPDLIIIDKKDNSPYIYVEATAMVEDQTTNLFIETEEDGKIQTYVVNLLVTEPKNIREQVAVNLVSDNTPPIRGGEGSNDAVDAKQGFGIQSTSGASQSNKNMIGTMVAGHFDAADVKKYLNTMIEMADHYAEAKQIEKRTGRIIYRSTDIKAFPSGRATYIDPIEGTLWNVQQVWFFPKYDAILLDVRTKNPKQAVSMWDFSQMRWQANGSPQAFPSTAAAPLAMQTLPGRNNQIWYLIQGNRLDPHAEFSPVFPNIDHRGIGRELPKLPMPVKATPPQNLSSNDGKTVKTK